MTLDFEDLDVFFDPDIFGQEILVGDEYQEIPILGIFESAFYESSDGRPSISSRQPTVTCKDCDIEDLGIAQGTRIVVDDVVYQVKDVEPDGTGTSVVSLSRKRG